MTLGLTLPRSMSSLPRSTSLELTFWAGFPLAELPPPRRQVYGVGGWPARHKLRVLGAPSPPAGEGGRRGDVQRDLSRLRLAADNRALRFPAPF